MTRIAEVFIPEPTSGNPLELVLLQRLREHGEELVTQYIERYTRNQVHFVGRDAAKRMFPEYVASPTTTNRASDAAASALADAARRTLLARSCNHARDRYVLITGAPASGKSTSTGLAGSKVEIEHETILQSAPRACDLIDQALTAGRVPVLHLFYTDDPRINVQRMVKRARRIGRTVPVGYMAKMYLTVPAIIQSLSTTFGRRLEVLVTDNSEAPDLAVNHNRVERALYHVNRYTEASTLEAMHAELSEISEGPDGIPAAILEEALRA